MPAATELLGVLLGNGLVAWAYFTARMTIGDLLWVYWLQSVAIGLSNFVRMASLRRFSTAGLTSNGKPVPETPRGKWSASIFFLFHYGFFHVGYAVFLATGQNLSENWPQWVALTAGGLIVGEALTLARHRRLDAQWKPNLGTMMFQPYLRIIPMHLTIIFGAMTGPAALIFIPLKIVADVGMLLVEERREAKRMKVVGA